MPLLDLVPPAIDLVAHHCRLFDKQRALRQQSKQRLIRPGHDGEKLPPRKDAHPAGNRQLSSHLLIVFRAFQLHSLSAQPPMHRG